MDEDLIDEIRSAMGVPCDTIPLPPAVDSNGDLRMFPAKRCGNSHGREFDLRAEQLRIKETFNESQQHYNTLVVLSLIGFVGYAGWFWTELSAINKEIVSLKKI